MLASAISATIASAVATTSAAVVAVAVAVTGAPAHSSTHSASSVQLPEMSAAPTMTTTTTATPVAYDPLSLAVTMAVVVLTLTYAIARPSAAERCVRHLPRPASTLPVIGNSLDVLLRYKGRVHDYLLDETRAHGEQMWCVQLLGRPVTVVLTSPAAFEHVLATRFADFGKGALTTETLRDVLGGGIFAVDGARWRHQRKTASHLFSLQRMRDTMELAVRQYTAALCDRLAVYASAGVEASAVTATVASASARASAVTASATATADDAVAQHSTDAASLSDPTHTLASQSDLSRSPSSWPATQSPSSPSQAAPRSSSPLPPSPQPPHAPVNLKRLLDLFTMDVFARIGFGVDLRGLATDEHAAFLEAFERASRHLFARFQAPLWLWRLRRWLRVGRERQLARDVQRINAFVLEVIDRSVAAKRAGDASEARDADVSDPGDPSDTNDMNATSETAERAARQTSTSPSERTSREQERRSGANARKDLISLFLDSAVSREDKRPTAPHGSGRNGDGAHNGDSVNDHGGSGNAHGVGGDGNGDGHTTSNDRSPASATTDATATATTPMTADVDDQTQLIRDMALNFLAAGRDTTSQSMAWFLVMLNRHPHVLARVRDELRDKLPHVMAASTRSPASSSSSGATVPAHIPTMEDVAQLPYLEAALRESLRLNPVVALTARTALCDTTLPDGTRIVAGTRVVLPHYVMARLTSVWGDDAEAFKPERWLDAATGKLVHVSPFQFSPFLAGPRTCLGMRFALMEMKIAMVAVLSQFDIETVRDPFAFTYSPSITLAIKGPLDVRVRALRRE